MPPEALKPARCAACGCAAMAPSMVRAASGVALTAVLPVLVLMKSAPASSAKRAAWAISALLRSSPLSRMTLSVCPAQAPRAACSNRVTAASSPASRLFQGSTRSTSCAPARTMVSVSRSARSTSALPSGKLATAATAICAGSRLLAKPAKRGQTQTAATGPHGPCARAHSAATSASQSASFRLVRSRQASAILACDGRRGSSSMVVLFGGDGLDQRRQHRAGPFAGGLGLRERMGMAERFIRQSSRHIGDQR